MQRKQLKTQPRWMCKYAIPYADPYGNGLTWRCGYKEFLRTWIIPRDVITDRGDKIDLVPKNEHTRHQHTDDPSVYCTMYGEAYYNSHPDRDEQGYFSPTKNTHMSVLPGGCPMYVERTKDEMREMLFRIYNNHWNKWARTNYCGLCSVSSHRPHSELLKMEEYCDYHILSNSCKKMQEADAKKKRKGGKK